MPRDQQPVFHTTRWSLVIAAGSESTDALAELCRTYWFPAYAVARSAGHDTEDARDLVQGFFARLLEKGWLESADQTRGRFRTYFLTLFRRYMANEWHRENTHKRGGRHEVVRLDTALAERLYATEQSHHRAPDALFDRRWAISLLDAALARLESHYRGRDKLSEFETLQPSLTAGRGEIDYPTIATALGSTEAAARVAVHRIRKNYRQFFREEIARTLEDDTTIDEEMQFLLSAL